MSAGKRRRPEGRGGGENPGGGAGRGRGGWLAAQAAFVALFLLAMSPILAGKVEPLWDASDYFYPAFAFFQRALRAGRLPFWDPFTACGMPFLADPQNSYPLSPLAVLLAALVPAPSTAFALFWVFTWLWGGLGAARLARVLGASPLGGLVAAVLWTGSGYYVAHAEHTAFLVVLSWTPWTLALAHEAVDQERPSRALLAGVSLGLSAAAGYPGLVIFECLFLALWLALAFLLPARAGVDDRRPWTRRLAWVVGVLAVSGLLLLVLWSPTLYAFFRDGRGYTDRVGALPRDVATSVESFPWPAIWSLLFPSVTVVAPGHMGADVSMTDAYLGAVTLPLALLWVWRGGARRAWWFVIFVLLAFTVTLGAKAGLRSLLYDLLPPTRYTRHAAALRGFWMVAVCAAAGAGLGLWVEEEGRRSWWRLMASWAGVALVAGVALLLWANGQAVSLPVVRTFLPAGLAMAAVALILLPVRGETPPWRIALILLVLIADLGWHVVDHESTLWSPSPGPIAAVERAKVSAPAAGPRTVQPLLGAMNVQQVLEIPVVRGYVTLTNSLFDPGLVATPYLQVLASQRFWLGPAIYAPAAEQRAILARSGAGQPVPVLVDGPGGSPSRVGSTQAAVARITAYTPEQVDLAVEVPPGEGLVLASTERWAPGWRAFVDGAEATPLRTNLVFRGVAVPPGSHRVSWRFGPGLYPVLLAVAWASGLLAVLAATVLQRRRR